jgi:hypothetical protein
MKLICALLVFVSLSALAKDEGRYRLYSPDGTLLGTMMIDSVTGNIYRHRCVKFMDDKSCVGWAWDTDDIIGINTTYPKLMKQYDLEQPK